MRAWERGSGETLACGTGACAAVAVACELGECDKGTDITVKLRGGDLIVNYSDDGIVLTGNAHEIYEGELKY
jgi:carbamoyl-phosphate synthase large subunit